MKTNNENILKYLSDLMEEGERKIFEAELSKSTELKEKLTETRERLMNMKVYAESTLDERYFGNLLPRVHQKLKKERKPQFAEIIYYFVPYTAAAIIGLLFLFKPTNNFDSEYKDLAGKVVNNITDRDVATKYFDETDIGHVYAEHANSNNSLSSLIPANLNVNDESASKILNGTVMDEYASLYGYSDDELKTIAANLDKLNIK